jgi:mono/diheme cytochrome c family protein
MKRRHPLPLFGFAILLASIATSLPPACGQDHPAAVFVEPATPETKEILGAGEYAINRLATTMVGELRTALAKGGPEDAIGTCHLKALPMTGGRITGLPRIKAFKLTSLLLRSTANAPDAADQLALDRVDRALNAGDAPPKLLLQRIDAPGAAPAWRVYRPLGIATQCLVCHGDTAEQSPALRAKLDALYPADKATGYTPGAWRGLIRVTVDTAPPPPPAPKPAPSPVPRKK